MIPNVNGALGMVPKGLEMGLEESEIKGRIKTIQTTELLRSAWIMRRVLGDLVGWLGFMAYQPLLVI